MSRLESLTSLKQSPVTARETKGPSIFYQGFGPLGGHMFSHFVPVKLIIGEYDGEEVPKHAEKGLGAKVFTYERKKGVRHTTSSLFNNYFYQDYGKEIATAMAAIPGKKVFAPFNSTPAIERFLFESAPDVYLAQNPVVVRRHFEDKILLALHAKEINVPLPPSAKVQFFGELEYKQLSHQYPGGFVIQVPMSQHGGGTDFIFNEDDFNKILEMRKKDLKDEFTRTQVKLTPYLNGPSLNCTGCVVQGGVALSPVDIQIVGDPNFTTVAGAYCGSDFSFPLSEEIQKEVFAISLRCGKWLGTQGYRGNFGVDLLSTMDTDGTILDIYVSEINARLVGESQYLADFEAMQDIVPLTFFHLAEFLRWDVTPKEVEAYNDTLRPVQGAVVIIYSHQKGIFKATGGLTSGVYRMDDGKLKRIKDGWTLSDSTKPDEFIITNGVPWEGLTIGHPRYGDEGIPLLYLMTRESILDPKNPKRVNLKWVKIAETVENAVGLTPTEPKSLREG